MTSTIITAGLLREKGVSQDCVATFSRFFPNGTPARRDEALAAALKHAAVFSWFWPAVSLLSEPAFQAYGETYRATLNACTEAGAGWHVFDEAISTAFINAWFDQCEGD